MEQPGNRIELVRQGDGRPGDTCGAQDRRLRRSGRFHGRRKVVVIHGLPHGLGLTTLARVDAAHLPLQFGELAHHVGGQVGFGEQARPLGMRGLGLGLLEHVGRNPARQRRHTV